MEKFKELEGETLDSGLEAHLWLEPEEEGRGELQGDLGGSFLDGVLEVHTAGDLRGPPSICSLLLALETGF